MTKKQAIKNMINEAPSFKDGSKTINRDLFHKHGLHGRWEYGEKWNDVIYTMRVAKEMGYTSGCGLCLHLFKKI